MTNNVNPRQAESLEAVHESRSSDFESEKIEETSDDNERQQSGIGRYTSTKDAHQQVQANLQGIIIDSLKTELLHEGVAKDSHHFKEELQTSYSNLNLNCQNLLLDVQHDIVRTKQKRLREEQEEQLRLALEKEKIKSKFSTYFQNTFNTKTKCQLEEELHL